MLSNFFPTFIVVVGEDRAGCGVAAAAGEVCHGHQGAPGQGGGDRSQEQGGLRQAEGPAERGHAGTQQAARGRDGCQDSRADPGMHHNIMIKSAVFRFLKCQFCVLQGSKLQIL